MEIVVNGPDGANRLFICSGIAEVEVGGGEPHPRWEQVFLQFDVGREFDPGKERVLKTISTASIGGVRSDGVPNFVGWRVYGAAADLEEKNHRVRMNIAIGSRDSQAFLEQVVYTVHILAYVPD